MVKLTVTYDEANWHLGAACAGKDGDLFSLDNGGTEKARRPAERICGGCAVRTFCLEEGLASGEGGMWGGLSERQIREIQKRSA